MDGEEECEKKASAARLGLDWIEFGCQQTLGLGGGCNLTLQVQVFGDWHCKYPAWALGLTLGSARHTSGGTGPLQAWEQSRSRQLELVEAL